MHILKHELKTLFFIFFAASISLLVLLQRNHKIYQPVFSATLPVFSTPTPTEVPPGPVEVTTMDSSEGTMTLTMKKQQIKDLTTYSFFTSDKSGGVVQFIFTKEENSSQNLSIPYNTWSPDNVYLFLKETTPAVSNYYVFYVSGESFPNDLQYLNIQDLFTQKVTNYILTDVTGWAAPNLLIVNTKTDQGIQGPSFWFDVPSQSFIQLGTLFN